MLNNSFIIFYYILFFDSGTEIICDNSYYALTIRTMLQKPVVIDTTNDDNFNKTSFEELHKLRNNVFLRKIFQHYLFTFARNS